MAKKTTAPKQRAAKPAPKAAPAPSNVVPLTVDVVEPVVQSQALRLRDLVDRVAEASGGNKKDLRGVIEATLAVLGQAIDAGDVLNLPPLGKLRVARAASGEAGAVTLKLRRNAGGKADEKADKEGLAEDGEDS
jgi:DNA-binding protein HU-alpha